MCGDFKQPNANTAAKLCSSLILMYVCALSQHMHSLEEVAHAKIDNGPTLT